MIEHLKSVCTGVEQQKYTCGKIGCCDIDSMVKMSKAEHEMHVKNECSSTMMQCRSCNKILGERKEVRKTGFSHKIKDCVDEILVKTKKVKKDKL